MVYFRWIPVEERLPDRSEEAIESMFLVTIKWDEESCHVGLSSWGPMNPDRQYMYMNSTHEEKNYIYDNWAFGDMWDKEIVNVDTVIAWAPLPKAYHKEEGVVPDPNYSKFLKEDFKELLEKSGLNEEAKNLIKEIWWGR